LRISRFNSSIYIFLYIRGSFDKFDKFPWNGATIHLMTRKHLERSTLRTPSGQISARKDIVHVGSHLKRDWRAKKCSSIKTTRRPTSRPLQWQNYELDYELIPHPPYSPDLAPCDFFLFPNLKTWLGGKKFSSKEVIVAVNKYFADFETAYFKWLRQRELCVLSGWNFTWRDFEEWIFRDVASSNCSAISWKFIKFIKRRILYTFLLNVRLYISYNGFEVHWVRISSASEKRYTPF